MAWMELFPITLICLMAGEVPKFYFVCVLMLVNLFSKLKVFLLVMFIFNL